MKLWASLVVGCLLVFGAAQLHADYQDFPAFPTQINVTVTGGTVAATQSGVWTTGRTWSLLNTTDSVTAYQGGTWTLGRTWNLSSGSDSVAAVQSGPWVVQISPSPLPVVVVSPVPSQTVTVANPQVEVTNPVSSPVPVILPTPTVTVVGAVNASPVPNATYTAAIPNPIQVAPSPGATFPVSFTSPLPVAFTSPLPVLVVSPIPSQTITVGNPQVSVTNSPGVYVLNTTASPIPVTLLTPSPVPVILVSPSPVPVTPAPAATFPVSFTSPLPVVFASPSPTISVSVLNQITGYATSANQTNGSQQTQITDPSGHIATVKAANTAASAADTAQVVAQSPTSPFSYFHPVFTTRVQTVAKATTASSTSLAVTINSTGAADLIVVLATVDTTTAPTITDSAAQTYSTAVNISSGTAQSYMFYKANTAAGVTSVTVSDTTSTAINVVVLEYADMATSSPLDQTASHAQTATTSWTSSATTATTQASELLVGGAFSDVHNNTTYVAGTGWLEANYIANSTGGVNLVSFMEDQYVNATGTYAATGTTSQADSIYASIATFKTGTLPSGFTTVNSPAVIKSGAGTLKSIIINSPGTGSATATFYDNTTNSGTVIATVSLTNGINSLNYNVHFSTGLTMVVTSTTGDFTVVYN